jgi:hemerythrin-like domain-containing protein
MAEPIAESPHVEGQCPIDMIALEHALQLELNKALEFIADGLPDQVDRRLVGRVTDILDRGLAGHFEFEEKVLFPMLRASAGTSGDTALLAALDQLVVEHVRDEDTGLELVEELRYLAEQGRPRNAEMLGYMLRGYFEGQRRHIEWENSVVLPAARRLLGRQQLDEIKALLGQRGTRSPFSVPVAGSIKPEPRH